MSVVKFEKHWNGATGSATQEGREYAAVYKCVTDDPLDNAQTIIDYVITTGGFELGVSPYNYGNDYDPNSILKGIDPNRLSESNLYWDVVLSYAPIESTENQSQPDASTDGSESTTNPEDWYDRFNIDSMPITIPCEKAVYRGGYKGTADRMLKRGDSVTIPQNSAFVPFSPGIETDIFGQTITRSFYVPSYDNVRSFERLLGHVNDNVVLAVVAQYNFAKTYGKYTLKLNKVGARNEFINGGHWWNCTLEMWWNPLSWRAQIVDRGRYIRQAPGDKDPITGATLSSNDFTKGDAYVKALTDASGNVIDDDVLFDGDGAPLDPERETVYGIWSKAPESTFPISLFSAKTL